MWRNNGSHYALHRVRISTFHREIWRSDRRGGSNRSNTFCCCNRKPVENSCCACGRCRVLERSRMSQAGRRIADRLENTCLRPVRTTGPCHRRPRICRRMPGRWTLRAPCCEASRRVPTPRGRLKQGPALIIWRIGSYEASIFSQVAHVLGTVGLGGDLPQMNSVWQGPFAE